MDFPFLDKLAERRRFGMRPGLDTIRALMERLGCAAAYNLDGGHSAVMTLRGEIVNSPSKAGGRDISDILYLTESETEAP